MASQSSQDLIPSTPAPTVYIPGSSDNNSDARTVQLRIGNKLFDTYRTTLTTQSGFFERLLSDRWVPIRDANGAYFVDGDPVVFEHVLRFLRRKIFPVLYDRIKGHDDAMYLAILEDARYYDIPPLVEWLEQKRYNDAVKIRVRTQKFEGAEGKRFEYPGNTEVEVIPSIYMKKLYACPRDISVHDEEWKCGRRCKQALGDRETLYREEEDIRVLIIENQVVFTIDACHVQE